MENTTDKTQFGEGTRELFRSSASWMRGYAIVMIIMVSFIALAVLVLSADRDGAIIRELSKSSGNEIVNLIVETFGLIIFGMACFVILFGYASIKLLGAANKFTAISYSATKEDLIKGFKNLRLFWMYYGITLIVFIVLGIYFMIKVVNLVSAQAQP
jgi:hypothetical protein